MRFVSPYPFIHHHLSKVAVFTLSVKSKVHFSICQSRKPWRKFSNFLLLLGVFHTHFCVGASISESGNVQVMNMYVCRLGLILSARLVVPL